MNTLKIQQIKSEIKTTERQKQILRGLGLRGIGRVVYRENTPSIRGMVKKILHLVFVSEEKKIRRKIA